MMMVISDEAHEHNCAHRCPNRKEWMEGRKEKRKEKRKKEEVWRVGRRTSTCLSFMQAGRLVGMGEEKEKRVEKQSVDRC